MMKVRHIAFSLILVLLAGGITYFHFGEKEVDAAINVEATAIAAMEAQLLASTVQIELFDQGSVEGDQIHTRVATGLGTVVQYGGRRYVLTHNHWSIPTAELNRVEIRNGAGELLLVLPGTTFYTLVRYQDGGTMVLDAPEELAVVPAAELGDGADVLVGNTVWMATYADENRNDIEIETAWVEELDASFVPGRFWLQGDEDAVIVGDSGGGIWIDGKLVGNLWGIYVVHTDYVGNKLFDLLDNEQPTGEILAGMQPLTRLTGVTAEDLNQDVSLGEDYERGVGK